MFSVHTIMPKSAVHDWLTRFSRFVAYPNDNKGETINTIFEPHFA
jgi:hypothetical protein